MAGIEATLESEFPEATRAEVHRFVAACQKDKNDADKIKEEAEKMLEDYLDWRSCYGLDYKKAGEEEDTDSADWKYAIAKTLEVNASIKRAKELAKKLAEEAKKGEEEKKTLVNYDIDLSDSQKAEDDKEGDEPVKGKECDHALKNESTTSNGELSDEEKKLELSQMIFLHKDKDGKPITDKNGHKILHVLPGLINRKVAQADFYGLALAFYLDQKLDRESEEKMTIFIDVRAGEGWPNPVAFMMIKFVNTITKELQSRYPERLQSLILFPVPRAAMGVWSAMKRVFRFGIMDKVTLVSGAAGSEAPFPKAALEEQIDGAVLDLTEHFRLDHFKPIGSYSDE